ncbi:MAG TPA: glycosyltransferase [Tepidisphaeraceae bacterium]|nr:glycosyltransferase [Tepidisphaeraceae bacterium]
MIFVTVGTQLPFDRMVRAIDAWAGRLNRDDVFAQIGPTEFRPGHLQWAQFLPADQCRQKVEQASVVVAHAGMGTIITAWELGKPIIVMPRRADLGEHRNEHQLATAKRFQAQGRIVVAFDEAQLVEKLDQLGSLHASQRISSQASPRLLNTIRAFCKGEDVLSRLRSEGMPAEPAAAGRPDVNVEAGKAKELAHSATGGWSDGQR